jgi:hypothetical protein
LETQATYHTDAGTEEQENGVRRFLLVRERDLTGVSGTGIVAEGAVFSGGVSILHWLKAPYAIGMFQSITDLIAVHGHEGATHIQFIDQE